jgi:hypothetical protein
LERGSFILFQYNGWGTGKTVEQRKVHGVLHGSFAAGGGTTIKTSKAIRNRITWRLDAWDRDEFAMLVQTTAQEMPER